MKKEIPQNPDALVIGGSYGWAFREQFPSDWKYLFVMQDEAKVEEARETGFVKKFFDEKIKESNDPTATEKIKLSENTEVFSLANFCRDFRGQIEKVFLPFVPANSLRPLFQKILEGGVSRSAFEKCLTISGSKGLESKTLKLPPEISDDFLEVESIVALGGNLAFDLVRGHPMRIEFAGDPKKTALLSKYLADSNLDIFCSRNRRKLDAAGPIKNSDSLLAGITHEISGHSSVAGITTIGLEEYDRAAFILQFPQKWRWLARQIQKIPFNFRSVPIHGGAVSDYKLFDATRNFKAGQELIRLMREGKTVAEAIAIISKKNTIESFSSTIPTRDFLRQLGTPAATVELNAAILEGQLSVAEIKKELLTFGKNFKVSENSLE